ncbi:hypothetical protein [Streptomyces sp. BE303]|uniref:hypothetical protein n=1 Tax=Streptomyces sp. BE303 TaxID=3002528 RepID=UPI002E78F39C|nr:hypothetical protein [Streptomyces sp. BE303]MED7948121.1 hypothetical protein [Streptomyces sp. BE303]
MTHDTAWDVADTPDAPDARAVPGTGGTGDRRDARIRCDRRVRRRSPGGTGQ